MLRFIFLPLLELVQRIRSSNLLNYCVSSTHVMLHKVNKINGKIMIVNCLDADAFVCAFRVLILFDVGREAQSVTRT